ncbi:MAG: metal-dependent hydrolase, partial [Ferruginibacter sp.]|nr:metal-dependent hydrolase [Ferruginibacter sp.]
MDTITHIAIGACIGEAFFERGFGKKAMIWGVLAQSIPDIDFISHLWLNIPEALLGHRGFTHSIFFAILIVPFFALLADKIHQPHNISFRRWIFFFATEVFFHLFIDAFNNYGIGWFEPFSHERFSFNAIYVFDPLFSVWPVIAIGRLIILNKYDLRRKFWWRLGIIVPVLYIGICSINKLLLTKKIEKQIHADQSY